MAAVALGADFWSWVLSDQDVDDLRRSAAYWRICDAMQRRARLEVRVGDHRYMFDGVDELFAALPALLRANGREEDARGVERFVDRVHIELATAELDGMRTS